MSPILGQLWLLKTAPVGFFDLWEVMEDLFRDPLDTDNTMLSGWCGITDLRYLETIENQGHEYQGPGLVYC